MGSGALRQVNSGNITPMTTAHLPVSLFALPSAPDGLSSGDEVSIQGVDSAISAEVGSLLAAARSTKRAFPEWGLKFLALVDKCGGDLGLATTELGLSYTSTWRARRDCADLELAVKEIQAKHDDLYGQQLLSISKTNALQPKSVIERLFHIKKLYPEFRERQAGDGNTVVVVQLGFKSHEAALDEANEVKVK